MCQWKPDSCPGSSRVHPRPLTLIVRTDIANKAGFLAWLISTEPEAALAVPQEQEQEEEMKQADWLSTRS